jgi:hypothetical protein
MDRLKAPSSPAQPGGSAAIAKRRLVAALGADRRAAASAGQPALRPESQLLAQLLAAPAAPERR